MKLIELITPITAGFQIHELFSRAMCEKHSVIELKSMMDPQILNVLSALRRLLDRPIYVNNWFWAGDKQYRGFREPNTPWYSAGSAHSFGHAIDFNVKDMSVADVHAFIFENEMSFLDLGLRRLEHIDDAPTWIHMDSKFTGLPNIHVFRK